MDTLSGGALDLFVVVLILLRHAETRNAVFLDLALLLFGTQIRQWKPPGVEVLLE